jgi:hypothetical protein
VALAARKLVRPVDSVRWLAIAAACLPGIPALVLVIVALSTQSLQDWEQSLSTLSVPFALAPLAAYGLWTLSRHHGGKLSFGTSLLLVGLAVLGALAIVPAFLIGVSAAALAQDKTGALVMAIAALIGIATGLTNLFLFVLLIMNRK